MYMLKGNLIQAEVLLNNSYTILQKNLHPDIYLVLESLANLSLMKAKLLKNKHNIQKVFMFHEQAHNYLNQAYEVVKSHFGNSSPHLFRIREKLSNHWYSPLCFSPILDKHFFHLHV